MGRSPQTEDWTQPRQGGSILSLSCNRGIGKPVWRIGTIPHLLVKAGAFPIVKSTRRDPIQWL